MGMAKGRVSYLCTCNYNHLFVTMNWEAENSVSQSRSFLHVIVYARVQLYHWCFAWSLSCFVKPCVITTSHNVTFHYREIGGRKFRQGFIGGTRRKGRVWGEGRVKTAVSRCPYPPWEYFNKPAKVILPCTVVTLLNNFFWSQPLLEMLLSSRETSLFYTFGWFCEWTLTPLNNYSRC